MAIATANGDRAGPGQSGISLIAGQEVVDGRLVTRTMIVIAPRSWPSKPLRNTVIDYELLAWYPVNVSGSAADPLAGRG